MVKIIKYILFIYKNVMKTNLNYLDDFLDDSEKEELGKKDDKQVIKTSKKDGLFERVDRVLIVEDGRRLLRD